MNRVDLIGRLVRDPEVRYTQSNKAFCTFTIAVNRPRAKEGQQTADFISCQAWDKLAENIGNFLHKGSKAAVSGRIQTRSFEQDGQKKFVTDVVATEVEFLDPKQQASSEPQPATCEQFAGQAGIVDDIPF